METRRDFLRLVLLGSGAVYSLQLGGCKKPSEIKLLHSPRKTFDTPKFRIAHAYMRDRTPLPAPTRTELCDVIVVGVGFSGLSAAVQLQKAGKHVVMLDSESKSGGTAISANLAGGYAPLGSAYFVEETDELKAMLELSGVQAQPCPEDGYVFEKGTVVKDLWTDSTLNHIVREGLERDGMKRFRDYMLGLGDNLPLYPLNEVLSPEQAALDVSAEEWIKSFESQTLSSVINSYSRSSMGALLSRTNVYCLQNFYVSEFGPSLGTQRFTFAGGTGAFSSAVAKKINNIRNGMLVAKIANTHNGAEVHAIDDNGNVTKFLCSHVIVASQKYQAPYIVQDLPEEQIAACKRLSYAPYMTLHVVSDVPLMQHDIYDTWNLTSEFETDVINPRSVEGGTFEKYVSSLYLPMDQFARGQLQDSDLFARRATDVVDRFLTNYSKEQQESVREVFCWGWGHSMVVPTPGSHSGIAQAARRRHGNILFANTDCDAAPAIENAANQGARAAYEILEPTR